MDPAPVSKPKVASILTLVSAIITLVVIPLVDGDPATQPQYATALTLVMSSVGLWFSRNNGTSSEQAGIK